MRGVHGSTRQGVAGIRGVRAGKQMSCSILRPRNAADGKLCSTRGGWGRRRTRQPALPPSQVPSVASPEVSKSLTQKQFSAIPQNKTPSSPFSVLCKALPAPHLPQGTGAGHEKICSKHRDDVADLHHTSASATGSQDPCQETCHHTMWLSQPQVSPDRRPTLLGGETIRAGFEHVSLCCFSLVCKRRGPAGHPKAS